MRRPWRWVLVLAAVHLVAALAFSAVTPWLTSGIAQGKRLPDIGAPDEAAHFEYVRRIGSGQLPVLTSDRPNEYESHQPPLAYLPMALISRSPEKDFSGYLARVPDAVFGALTVLAVFLLAQALKRSEGESLTAAAIVAFLPMQIALSGAASNDPLLILLCTAALVPLALAERDGWNPGQALAFGLLAGAAGLTKTTGVLLLPAGALALYRGRADARSWLLALGLPILIVAPWIARNLTLYGDPFALNAFKRQFPPDVNVSELKSPRGLAHWLYVLLAGLFESTIGQFGYMDIHFPLVVYLVVGGTFFIAMAVGFRKVKLGLPIAIFTILTLLSLVAFNLSYVQPQARYLFPILGPMAVWAAAGIRRPVLPVMLAASAILGLSILPAAFQERTQPLHIVH